MLNLSGLGLKKFPDNLDGVEYLNLAFNEIELIDQDFPYLNLSYNKIKEIPELDINQKLVLCNNLIKETEFYLPNCFYLDLANNNLENIDLGDTPDLIHLDLSNNNLINIELQGKIIELNLSQNNLSKINLKNLPYLQYIDLSSNPIERIDGINYLTHVTFMDITNTKMASYDSSKIVNLSENEEQSTMISLIQEIEDPPSEDALDKLKEILESIDF